ncbi:amidohydrolase family protein [Synechococcus sp. CBW1002]|uniref:amidohydrolase family protein n=1 Tax=Synechococcus sp. CBW1002 TaxID=1353134 RepID=UPI001E5B761E|nr:amidohydrolase family protein [Synechococcus sp. CBW1002]
MNPEAGPDQTAPPSALDLQLPRQLLDPGLTGLPAADADGLVAVRLRCVDGRIAAIEAWPGCPHHGLDPAALPLALTPLVEPHAHLDKAFSWAPHANRSGTIAGAMAANRNEANERTQEQIHGRGERALERGWRQGLRAMRSHIDSLGAWWEPSWQALEALRLRWADRLELELVALVPLAHWGTPAGEALAARVAATGGLLGGVLGPPYRPSRDDQRALEALLRLAERHGCGIDLHIDESDQGQARGVRMLLQVLRHQPCSVPITCSHASSLALLPERQLRPLLDQLAAAGVAVVALPGTNHWLLDRRPGCTPRLRPQAPVRQLQAAGVLVAIGGDNVQDPWFPGGDFDPIEVLRFSVAASHQAPWLRQGLAPFSTEAARLLRLPWDGVLRQGGPADLVVLAACSWSEVLARSPQRRVLRGGHWLPPPLSQQPAAVLASVGGMTAHLSP